MRETCISKAVDGQERKRAEQLKICKNAAEMTLFRRTLFSIYFQSWYISNKVFHFWLINVRLAGSRNRLFFPCLSFFQLAKNWLCCPYTEKYSRDPTKRHQSTQGDFSLETSDRFHPLNFYFLFPISFISFTRTSCGLNIAGNAPFTTFVILYKVFTMSLVSKCWEHMCWSR